MKKLCIIVMALMLSVSAFGATWASKVRPDQDQMGLTSVWQWNDQGVLKFGTDLDWRLECDTAKTLEFIPITTDESSTFNIGADTAGADFKVFGATTGKYILWDASGDSLNVVGTSVLQATTATTVIASVGVQSTATSVTATADGTGTGLIPSNASFVVITSDNADKQVTLPANIVGMKMTLVTGATACEVICATAGAKINDVVCGATNEAALAADRHYELTCISSTEWIMVGYTHLGAVDTAVVPDAR